MNKNKLIEENNKLKKICSDLFWMARRYADGRQSVAVMIYNNAIEELVKMGVYLKPDKLSENTIWAKDGGGRVFDKLHDDHMTDTPVGRGEVYWPRGTRLCDEITNALGTDSPSQAAIEIKRLKSLDLDKIEIKKEQIKVVKKRGRKPKNASQD